ncbi:MAG TPA: 3D domain-containing protein [Gemmatimonadaceae bacterium]
MRRTTVRRLAAALLALGAAFALLAAARAWRAPAPPERLPPLVVMAAIRLPGATVVATRPPRRPPRGRFQRARVGEPVPIELTAYCLQGVTRRGRYVREGIVAADPRIFPLSRFVEVFVGGEYFGRFLVDDTGGKIKGPILDVWKPTCEAAIEFGRRRGTAVLLPREARR